MKCKILFKILPLFLFFGLVSCSHIKPYHMDVQQGNILEAKVVQQLEIGMSMDEVVGLLGSPVLRNAFADNYWTYVYTSQINGGKIVKKELTLYFTGNKLTKIEKKNI